VIDEEGFPYILGRYGRIEWFDGRDLAVSSDRPRVFVKLWAIPVVRRYQTGDTEMRALFPLEALGDTASKRVDGAEDVEYLSIRDLAHRIPYAEQTIRNLMTRGVFRLGEHYIKPRSRIMFRWSKVRDWLDGQNNSA